MLGNNIKVPETYLSLNFVLRDYLYVLRRIHHKSRSFAFQIDAEEMSVEDVSCT